MAWVGHSEGERIYERSPMSLDPTEILDRYETKTNARMKAYEKDLFTYAVQVRIHDLFDDPQYPRRRRSFEAIRKKLGIFEGREAELRQRLFDMSAEVIKGEGEDQLWHLPPGTPRPEEPKKPRPPVLLLGLMVLAVAVAVLIFWEKAVGETFPETVARLFASSPVFETFQDCIAARPDDKTIPSWRIECGKLDYEQ